MYFSLRAGPDGCVERVQYQGKKEEVLSFPGVVLEYEQRQLEGMDFQELIDWSMELWHRYNEPKGEFYPDGSRKPR